MKFLLLLVLIFALIVVVAGLWGWAEARDRRLARASRRQVEAPKPAWNATYLREAEPISTFSKEDELFLKSQGVTQETLDEISRTVGKV